MTLTSFNRVFTYSSALNYHNIRGTRVLVSCAHFILGSKRVARRKSLFLLERNSHFHDDENDRSVTPVDSTKLLGAYTTTPTQSSKLPISPKMSRMVDTPSSTVVSSYFGSMEFMDNQSVFDFFWQDSTHPSREPHLQHCCHLP